MQLENNDQRDGRNDEREVGKDWSGQSHVCQEEAVGLSS